MENIITLSDCYKIYKDYQSEHETVALKGVNFSIRQGEIIVIIGPSGSGKSTLLNLIAGLDLPSAGKVIHNINGKIIVLSNLDKDKRDAHRSKFIGFMQQKPILYSSYTAIENVQLGLMNKGALRTRNKGEAWLEKLSLLNRSSNKPSQLSGGERQRVSLAATLVVDPIILLADEPTAEVDRKTAENMVKLLIQINKETGVTIVLVTHDLKVAKIANRSFYLVDGYIQKHEIGVELSKIVIGVDKFGRFQLPIEVLLRLNHPNLIALEKIDENKFRINNPEVTDFRGQDQFIVDKKGRVMFDFDVTKLKFELLDYEVNMEIVR